MTQEKIQSKEYADGHLHDWRREPNAVGGSVRVVCAMPGCKAKARAVITETYSTWPKWDGPVKQVVEGD